MRKRIRAVIAVFGIVATVSLIAAPVFAQETSEPKFADKAAEECHKLLEEGKSVDDCQKAPNPLVPSANEIIWGSLAFLVLLGIMWKFGVPAVKNMEQAREDRIRNDLEGAEKARTEAEAEKAQYLTQIAGAREEAGRIIEEARQSAEQVRRDLIARAEADAAEVRQRAEADIEVQRQRALTELRGDVAQLSIDLAERIVERNLDRDTQRQLVDSFIDQVGSNQAMADRVDVYARALLDIATVEGHLDEVEDELFRFARIVEGNDDLRMSLANPGLPLERRAAIVDELLDNRAMHVTKAIAAFIVGAGRGHDLPAIVDRFVALAAQGREHAVAEVRSAVALDDAQQQRIAEALSRATRKNVEVKVIVDESVMGGIVATIGDTVIDGTVRHRLDQLKEQI